MHYVFLGYYLSCHSASWVHFNLSQYYDMRANHSKRTLGMISVSILHCAYTNFTEESLLWGDILMEAAMLFPLSYKHDFIPNCVV